MPLYPWEVPQQDGPGWDDAAYGFLTEALTAIDRGEAKRALRLIKEARVVLESYVEDR